MAFKLPDLPYKYDALQPHIDKKTMMIHHGKHHAGYTNKLNAAIEGTDLAKASIEDILKKVSKYSAGVRNNGGGYYNHSMFWKSMSPNGGSIPSATSKLGKAMKKAFKTFDNFKAKFAAAAATRFGSGWAWLCVNRSGNLFISSTPNQDNPLMDVAEKKGTPILGLDVWEHAYYLKYQNRRGDYVSAFFEVVNWTEVAKRYSAATRPAKAKAKKTVAKKTTTRKVATKKTTTRKAAPKAKATKAKKTTAKKRATTKKTTAKKATTKKRTSKAKTTKSARSIRKKKK